jgi:hypothetical protein
MSILKKKPKKKTKSIENIIKKKSVKVKKVKKDKPKNKKHSDDAIDLQIDPLPIIESETEESSDSQETTAVEKKKKTVKEKMYFTTDTEDAIISYNECDDQNIRDEIYNTKIRYAFEKLVENVYNTFKFCYFETSPLEVQKETVTHLVANMHKFEKGKGKAFSYFSIIAKNYLIFQNNTNYKRFNQHVEIGDDSGENTFKLQQEDSHYKDEQNREFISLMVNYWEKNITKIFTKQRDINIANAVIELFRNSDRIDAFNKKALYLYIREISSCKTQQITKVINKMKNYQCNISKAYADEGSM